MSSTGIRVPLSTDPIRKWPLTIFFFKSAFLQTCEPLRDFFTSYHNTRVRKKSINGFFWLHCKEFLMRIRNGRNIVTTFYTKLWFKKFSCISKLFRISRNGRIQVVGVKAVAKFLLSSKLCEVFSNLKNIQSMCELDTVVCETDGSPVYGLQVIQDSDLISTVHGDQMLSNWKIF